MIKLNNVLLTSALLLTLTACGGGGGDSSTTIDPEIKKESIAKISNFASNSGIEPSKQDYINAGVDTNDLAYVDIAELNTLIKSKDATEVDSEEELNILAHTIMDKTAPVITINGATLINVPLNKNYTDAGATAIDNKDGEVVVKTTGNVNTSSIGTYTLTYKAADKFNNTAIKRRTVNVVADTAPVITLSKTSIKEKGDLKSLVTVTDDRDKNIEVTVSGETNTDITGQHHVVYTAKDSTGNEVRKEVDITVIPFTVHELITKGQSGELDDVSYHVIGDSTRNYPGKNTVLVDGYYEEKLTSNIKFSHSSYSGQRVEYWLNNYDTYEPRLFTEKETFAILDNKTQVKNQNHCIVEFSMGINDFIHENHLDKATLKAKIEKSIKDLQSKNVHILLVSPVPYLNAKDYRPETSAILNDIYEELKSQPNISFVSGYDAMLDTYPSNTIGDNLHPNNEGSKHLADVIFTHIENDDL
jgi:hypothetical protein